MAWMLLVRKEVNGRSARVASKGPNKEIERFDIIRAILSQWLWSGYGLVMVLRSFPNDLVMDDWHTSINLMISHMLTNK